MEEVAVGSMRAETKAGDSSTSIEFLHRGQTSEVLP
jgi:hypothetical protein